MIDELGLSYDITTEMIKEKKDICKRVTTVSKKIGNATLELDHLPFQIKVS
jgi:hypothetical protein